MNRNKYTAKFKAQVAIEVIKEERSINEIALEYGIHPDLVRRLKKQFSENNPRIFYRDGDKLWLLYIYLFCRFSYSDNGSSGLIGMSV